MSMKFGELTIDAKGWEQYLLGFWIVFISILPICIAILTGLDVDIKIKDKSTQLNNITGCRVTGEK